MDVENHQNLPINQHIVTRNLLSRFADSHGFIIRTFKASGQSSRRPPSREGTIPNFITADPSMAEMRWADVEHEMRLIYQHLDKGSLLSFSHDVETVKRFIALHIVRGNQAHQAMPQIFHDTVAKFEVWLSAQTGIPGPVREVARPAFQEEFRRGAFGGAMFRDILFYWYPFIGDDLQQYNLEIGYSPSGGFVIGDNPVVQYDTEIDQVNTGLNPADLLFMPFGPHHVISLTRGPSRYRDINTRGMEKLNELSIRSALARYYSKP